VISVPWETYKILGLTGNITITCNGPMAVGIFGVSGVAGFSGYFSGFDSVPRTTISSVDSICYGDTALLTATGAAYYRWSTGASSASIAVSPDTTIIYSVIGTHINGCQDTVYFNVTVNPNPLITITNQTNVSCYGGDNGSVTLSATNGHQPYAYHWSDNQTTATASGLTTGNYTVTVTDTLLCHSSATASVSQPTQLTASENHTDINCYGDSTGAISISASGATPPYAYSWADGAWPQNRANLAAGNYIVTVTDSNACSVSLTMNLSQPVATLSLSATHVDVSCFGGADGAINTNATGGTLTYSYLWGDGNTNPDRNNLSVGIYTITVTDNHLCTDTATITVTGPPLLSVTENHTNVNCYGTSTGAINVTPNGGTPAYSYTWSDGMNTQNRTGLSAATYNITVSDSYNCTVSIATTITQPTQLTITGTSTNVQCNGGEDGSITITPSGGVLPYSFLWADNSTSQNRTGLVSGSYSVALTDSNACNATFITTITEPTALLPVASATEISCNGMADGAINLTITGGAPSYSFLWSNASSTQNLSGLTAGTYNVTITDSHLCTVTATAQVIEPPVLSVSNVYDNPTCADNTPDGNMTITATGGTPAYRFAWADGSTGDNRTNLTAGTYNITVSDANNCSVSTSAILEYQFQFSLTTQPDVTIKLGESVALAYTVTGNPGNYSIIWNPDGALNCNTCASPVAKPIYTTSYQVQITNNAGCSASGEITVTVVPEHDIFIPNVFSPNGDGNNDFFTVYGKKETWKQFSIEIFNRIGEKVFDSNDMHFEWLGLYKGAPLPAGIYIYQASVVYIDNYTPKLLTGSITLVR
ncbi:MAG TPA: gliding motility-associated C-terminal domain-containing protein, partial [Chitinophagales bacterium]|nr:gliding motility-associated C-terminal domain-containing protein [Chitinophagales bacterium]